MKKMKPSFTDSKKMTWNKNAPLWSKERAKHVKSPERRISIVYFRKSEEANPPNYARPAQPNTSIFFLTSSFIRSTLGLRMSR